MNHVPICMVPLASKASNVDPRGGSRTGATYVPRSPHTLHMEEWIPEVALVQGIPVPRSPLSDRMRGWIPEVALVQGIPAFHVVHLPRHT